MSDSPDEPPRTREGVISTVSALRETFLAAGIDPASPAGRERFGQELRWLRERVEKSSQRAKFVSSFSGGVLLAVTTAALTALAPLLIRIFSAGITK